jgi:membrane-associated HD superfamily phosphohydrolase
MNHPDQSALKARNTLLALLLVLCILDATLVIIARDWWAIGRILPTIVVMYFVMQGQKWAKWFLIGICSLLVVILITMILALSSKLSTVLIVGSSLMAILSAIIAIYLVSSKDLNRYFVFKRQASF